MYRKVSIMYYNESLSSSEVARHYLATNIRPIATDLRYRFPSSRKRNGKNVLKSYRSLYNKVVIPPHCNTQPNISSLVTALLV